MIDEDMERHAAMTLLKVVDTAALDFSEFAPVAPKHLSMESRDLTRRLCKLRTALIDHVDSLLIGKHTKKY